MDWKLIETAPKDGRRLLVYDYRHPVFARWTDAMLVRDGVAQKAWMDDYGCSLQGVTHWTFQPDAPRTVSAQQQPISTETNVNEQRT